MAIPDTDILAFACLLNLLFYQFMVNKDYYKVCFECIRQCGQMAPTSVVREEGSLRAYGGCKS